MCMTVLVRIITLSVAIALAQPAWAEKITLSAISDYFNAMSSAKSPFTQVNADGTLSTGEILIRRPGRIRFEYNPPDASLVMAGKGQVAVFDPKSNQLPDRFPLTRTPLYLILAKTVNLSQANMVVGHTSDGTSTTVTAQDPKNPEYGNIQLVFTDAPVELRQWVVTDGTGSQTTVILGNLVQSETLRLSLFDIDQEMEDRGF